MKSHHIQQEWTEAYRRMGALWIHDGNHQRPHAELTSGKHSSGFFNSSIVSQDAWLLDRAAVQLVAGLQQCEDVAIGSINRVVGPAMGAITLAHDVARHITARCLMPTDPQCQPCYTSFTEKAVDTSSQRKRMAFTRTSVDPGETVLLVEDVITTGSSVELVLDAVRHAGGDVLPFVLTLVNRSGQSEVLGMKIISLITEHMPIWEPEECPLCQAGSEAIRPKEGINWARLNTTFEQAGTADISSDRLSAVG